MAWGVETRIEEKRSPVCDVASFVRTWKRVSSSVVESSISMTTTNAYVIDDGLRL